jgi:hypothetical protein
MWWVFRGLESVWFAYGFRMAVSAWGGGLSDRAVFVPDIA